MVASRLILVAVFLGCSSVHPATAQPVHRPTAMVAASHAAAIRTSPQSESTWVLSNATFEPLNFVQQPFIGNGYLGLRVPAVGEGYQGGNLGKSGFPLFNDRYTSALVAGVYKSTKASDFISSLPTWSEMDLSIDGHLLNAYTAPSEISHYRQSLDMRSGVVTTSLTWTPVPGKATHVEFTVLANRERMHLGEVQLTFRPSWSGSIELHALMNGRGAERIDAVSRTVDADRGTATLRLRTPGRNTEVAESQLLVAGPGTTVEQRSAIEPAGEELTAGVKWSIPVVAGETYKVVKYIGISTSNDPGAPDAVAADTVQSAARAGWPMLLAENRQAWARLWAGDISAPVQRKLQASIHSAFFLLYSSIRAGLAWSIPPAGLSSDNYAGEIFWDADIWMFPTLLTFHPDLARSVVQFRSITRAAAQANAAHAGYRGAMWAWDNGPTGTCGGLAPCSHYQDHLQSDIALAQWQYYLATGDQRWLAEYGFPVIKDVAEFWMSRVRLGADGKYHIDDVTGPDEFTEHVDDESLTNASAIVTLRNATAAALTLGRQPDPGWMRVADNIFVPVDPDGSHPEYRGYTNQVVKQADTVLMTYPYHYVTDPAVAAKDLDRYMAVTDPGGPAMTASVEGIIAAQVRQPGCLDYTLLENSYLPFLRGAYEQFLETQYLVPSARQGHPAFSFATGAGGFLQMPPFGFAGLRWSSAGLELAPTLPPQLREGITLHGVRYQGRTLTIAIGPHETTVTLDSGSAVPIHAPHSTLMLQPGQAVRLPTARPDLEPTGDLARCRPVTASSATRANPPAAAVDGNPVTTWQAASAASNLEIALANSAAQSAEIPQTAGATIDWGANRPASFAVSVPGGSGEWHQVAAGLVPVGGALQVHWPPVASRALRFEFRGGSPASIASLQVTAVRTQKKP